MGKDTTGLKMAENPYDEQLIRCKRKREREREREEERERKER